MMTINAVCIICGEAKGAPWTPCPNCGFDPRSDNLSRIKSIYLSDGRYIGTDEGDHPELEEELSKAQQILKNRGSVVYDETQLSRITAVADAFQRIPASAVWKALLRSFLPALWFLLAL